MAGRRELLSRVLARSGAWRIGRAMAPDRLLALCYHRIGDPTASPLDPGLFSATADQFDQQVAFLKSAFDLVGLDDLPAALASRRTRVAMITFDDGYRDNAEVAFPILKGHGAAATFFVSTGFIDSPSLPWWDKLALWTRMARASVLRLDRWQVSAIERPAESRAMTLRQLLRRFKALPGAETGAYLAAVRLALDPAPECVEIEARAVSSLWMTWSMLREMKGAGMSIGGHTVTHPVLARLPAEEQYHEIAGCRARLVAELGAEPIGLSYPVGGRTAFDASTRDAMRRAGYQFGFSYDGGTQNRSSMDPLDIHRLAVEHEFSLDRFVATTGWPTLIA